MATKPSGSGFDSSLWAVAFTSLVFVVTWLFILFAK
jgi:hypothetical protein